MRAAARGMTLVELMIVVAIMGVVSASALPRFGTAVESTRVDQAAATLRSIWHAQRMHWIEHHAYAPSLEALVEEQLLPAGLLERSPPFDYRLRSVRATRFSATAQRLGSRVWRGQLELDESGEISGAITNGKGIRVQPAGS